MKFVNKIRKLTREKQRKDWLEQVPKAEELWLKTRKHIWEEAKRGKDSLTITLLPDNFSDFTKKVFIKVVEDNGFRAHKTQHGAIVISW